jgi:hypothetical protein
VIPDRRENGLHFRGSARTSGRRLPGTALTGYAASRIRGPIIDQGR